MLTGQGKWGTLKCRYLLSIDCLPALYQELCKYLLKKLLLGSPALGMFLLVCLLVGSGVGENAVSELVIPQPFISVPHHPRQPVAHPKTMTLPMTTYPIFLENQLCSKVGRGRRGTERNK